MDQFRNKIIEQLDIWKSNGAPSRAGYEQFAAEMQSWKTANSLKGLWAKPPLMITATLDDAWGHGIMLINQIAEAMGCEVNFLGLCRAPEVIIDACLAHQPDFLGMTVLQFDSEELLTELQHRLPDKILTIAGGPVFKADDEFAERTGIHFVARHAADFMRYLLDFDES